MMKRIVMIAASAALLLVAFGCSGGQGDPKLDTAADGAGTTATATPPANSPKTSGATPAGKSSSPINPADLTK